MISKNYLISIVGPTAIGKTKLSVELAKHFNSDIISCDSRQFYKEMTIGTAVPEPAEINEVPHHFIQNISIHEDYNAGKFEKEVLLKLEDLFQKNEIQVMVGGSGLYADAVSNGLDNFPKVDKTIREDLKEKLRVEGIGSLQQELKTLDSKTFNSIDLNNSQRVIRALEICKGTGKPYSSFKKKNDAKRSFSTIKIGLTADREIIYKRINKRVDIMVENGLIEEARSLCIYRDLNALQTVGYKELFRYFDGEISKDFAIEEIKKNTRRFAKRQLTWFRKDKNIIWFDFTSKTDKIIEKIESIITDK